MPRPLRPHLLKPPAEDSLTRWLHRTLPEELQLRMREEGFTKSLLNGLGAVGAAMLLVYQPSLLSTYNQIQQQSTEIKYGFHSAETLYQSKISYHPDRSDSNMCLFFVHGGAWGSGDPWMYAICAYNLAKALDCDFCFNIRYPLYPDANILEQKESVSRAISFLRNLYPRHEFIVAGHSSGANLCALSMLDNHYHVSTLLLFNGVYDIHKHYLWEASRGILHALLFTAKLLNLSPPGVHLISPMGGAASVSFDYCSPTLIASRKTASLFCFPSTILVHHADDNTVPFTSSKEFAEELTKKKARVYAFYPQVYDLIPLRHFYTW